MLRNASAIKGYAIAASDGPVGTVSDVLFDDATWVVRWVVVDTGSWLSGRKVLLPPSFLGHLDPKAEQSSVGLTMQQVKDSPDIDADRPVSRQTETSLYDYYGWSPYWSGPADPHLRSIETVTGYNINASDGEIGHVEDFLVEDADWSIPYLVVDTKNWWPAKKVLISPRSAREIDWKDKLVHLDVNRQRVKDSPAYDVSTTVDRAYDETFLTYYGIRWIAREEPEPSVSGGPAAS